MAQAADTGSGSSGDPFAKFANIDDTLVGSFGGGKTRQQQDFEKKEPKWKDAATKKPLLEEVMWFSVMPGTTAFTGDSESPKPIAVGDIVRYAVGGFKWGQIIDQRRALPEYSGFAAGTPCSGDVYTIRLVGWSIGTDNAVGARANGFIVVEDRIVIRTQEEKVRYVMQRISANKPPILGNDFEITVRRPLPAEKAFEQAGDALFSSKPWDKQLATVGGGQPDQAEGYDPKQDEPF